MKTPNNETKTSKDILGLVMLFIVFPALFLAFYTISKNVSDPKIKAKYFLEDRKNLACQGIVDSIYRQKNNHNILTLRTATCLFQVESSWENDFKLGDSISKVKNEYELKIFRDHNLIKTLDYNDVAKQFH